MAITQISRIQHRRGLQQDLPQLASAELGWSLDQRRLFIGNGTLEEGAPTTGVTEILTEYTDLNNLFSVLNAYSFYGNAAGYTSLTGPSALSPTTRSYQLKFDDFVSIRDFGAIGDGVTDDTAAINRALQQIYKTGVSETEPLARRKIYFPGGTYLVSDTLLIPPYAKLVGDGISSTVIQQTQGNKFLANTADSKFQSGASLGTSGAVLPNDIEIDGIRFFNSNTNLIKSILRIDSASNISIKNSSFVGNTNSGVTPGYYPNLVTITSSISSSSLISFDNCKFLRAGYAVSIESSTVTSVRVTNSAFSQIANAAVNLGGSRHFVSVGNYYGVVTSIIEGTGSSNDFYQVGDYNLSGGVDNAGIRIGNLQLSPTYYFRISTTPTVIPLIANIGTIIEYRIASTAARRFGSMKLANYNIQSVFDDTYVETATIGANLYANGTSLIATMSSGSADFEYHYRRLFN
jgi:hypothetical protein